MTFPFQEHRFSPQEYEFVLATRRFRPKRQHVLIVAAAVGFLTIMATGAAQLNDWSRILLAAGAMGAVPLVYYWRTGQLGVQNYMLGNITSIMGHVNWPPIWQNVLAEKPVTFDWMEIEDITLRPKPWIFAPNNLSLELNFRDGRQRILRVPNLKPDEAEAFVQVLRLIALRRGFRFKEAPPLHTPL
jgi:hypothetical protein